MRMLEAIHVHVCTWSAAQSSAAATARPIKPLQKWPPQKSSGQEIHKRSKPALLPQHTVALDPTFSEWAASDSSRRQADKPCQLSNPHWI